MNDTEKIFIIGVCFLGLLGSLAIVGALIWFFVFKKSDPSTTPTPPDNVPSTSLTSSNPVPPLTPPREYETLKGIDISNNYNIRNFLNRTSIDDCNLECDKEPLCKAIVYDDINCWLKSEIKPQYNAVWTTNYVKSSENILEVSKLIPIPQVLIPTSQSLDISILYNKPFTIPPIYIDYTKKGDQIQYTFSFDIIIEKYYKEWRNIMCNGTNEHRQPGIFIKNLDNANIIHVSLMKNQINFAMNAKMNLECKKSYTVTVVIMNNTIYLYINGIKDNELKKDGNIEWDESITNWTWNMYKINNGYIKISNVLWWNIGLSVEQVAYLYSSQNKLEVSKVISTTPEYIIMPNINYSGTEISIKSKTLEECKELCNRDANCKGIVKDTDNCWLKNGFVDPSIKLDATTYFKPPENLQDYTLIPNLKFDDNNITQKKNINYNNLTLDACKQLCGDDPKCKGFVLGNDPTANQCQLKNNFSKPVTDLNSNAYFKSLESLQFPFPDPEYIIMPNINYYGNDIGGKNTNTLEECKVLCNTNIKCKGIIKNKNNCWLKDGFGDPIKGSDATTYFKPPENSQEYTIIPNLNFGENDIIKTNVDTNNITLDECKKLCSEDPNCKGFIKGNEANAKCWLKNNFGEPSVKPGNAYFKSLSGGKQELPTPLMNFKFISDRWQTPYKATYLNNITTHKIQKTVLESITKTLNVKRIAFKIVTTDQKSGNSGNGHVQLSIVRNYKSINDQKILWESDLYLVTDEKVIRSKLYIKNISINLELLPDDSVVLHVDVTAPAHKAYVTELQFLLF